MWKPIETAPQDGTRILLCSVCEDLQTGEWVYLDGPLPGVYDSGWRWGGEGNPSHWAPLPPAPFNS